MPTNFGRRVRYAVESALGRPITGLARAQDPVTGTFERNVLMYESAAPLAVLYNPYRLTAIDDTFVLQEFFCPHKHLLDWLAAAEPIFRGGALPGRHRPVSNLNFRLICASYFFELNIIKTRGT